jgi:ArsR family transcriptional regulator
MITKRGRKAMTGTERSLLVAKAKALKALGHPTRLFMVEELSKGECCVCSLVERIDADFSTVSKHLSVLKEAGLVEIEKRGQKVFYRLRATCVTQFIGCIETAIRENAERYAKLAR